MGFATSTIKVLVILFNMLCAFLGIGVIVVNSLALKNFADDSRTFCIVFIVLGSVVFLISFLGCCGAMQENICFIWTYATIMLILLIGTAVLFFGFAGKALDATTVVNEAWKEHINNNNNVPMGFFEATLHCCGKSGPLDYGVHIPNTCYPQGQVNPSNIYTDGCLKKVTELYTSSSKWINIISWVILGVETAAFVFAVILGIAFSNQVRRSNY